MSVSVFAIYPLYNFSGFHLNDLVVASEY